MAQIADWYLEFAAAVVAALPTEIEEATARRWAQDPDGLREMLAPLAEDSGIAPLRQDKSQDGWTLIKDVEEPKAITGADIEGVNFPEGTEDIIGEPIVAMIQEMDGLLGQRHAEYLMEHTGGIAEALERYALVFPWNHLAEPRSESPGAVPDAPQRRVGPHIRDTRRRVRLTRPPCAGAFRVSVRSRFLLRRPVAYDWAQQSLMERTHPSSACA